MTDLNQLLPDENKEQIRRMTDIYKALTPHNLEEFVKFGEVLVLAQNIVTKAVQ